MAVWNPSDRDPSKLSAGDRELATLLAEYLDRSVEGSGLDARKFLAASPLLGSELKAELAVLAEIESLIDDRKPAAYFGEDFLNVRQVGQGGMGVVYEAWQRSLERRVAIKSLKSLLLSDPKAVERFRREAMVGANLDHPNVVRVYSAGVETGTPYCVMEFADGETLEQILDEHELPSRLQVNWEESEFEALGALNGVFSRGSAAPGSAEGAPVSSAVPGAGSTSMSATPLDKLKAAYCRVLAEAFAGAAEGLHYAHSRGVLHRDLKPSNLILDAGGRLRILDFGLAHVEGQMSLTLSGDQVGTPLYMSPEQARKEDKLGPGTDVYSLGTTLYTMLAGQPPFTGKRYGDILDQIISCDPPPLYRFRRGIPRDLETIVLYCLRKNPQERYATAEGLAQDLRRFARGDPIEARPQPLYERVARRAWRSRGRLAAVAGVLAVVTLAALALARQLDARYREQDETYNNRVRGAAMKLVEQQILPLAAIPRTLLPEAVDAEVEKKGRLAYWQARRYEGGTLIEAGPAFTRAGPAPAAEAIAELRQAIEAFPERPIAYYYLARGLILEGRPEDAWAPLQQALGLDPKFIPARGLEVLMLEKAGERRASTARAELEGEVNASSQSWELAWLEANAAMLAKDWEAAAAAYERLADAGAENEHYLGSLMETWLGRGVARLNAGLPGEANEDFAAAFRKWPDWLQPALLHGKACYLAGKRARAESVFQSLLSRSGTGGRVSNDSVAKAVANLYLEFEDFGLAEEWVGRIESKEERRLLQAELRSLEGGFEEARDLAAGVLDKRPDDLAANLTLGNILWLEGEFSEARKQYEAARRLAPGDPRPLVQIGLCLESEGRLSEALGMFESAAGIDPALVQARYNAARLLTRLERREEALARYREVLRADPGFALAHNSVGILLDDQRDLRGAIAAYRAATHFDPRSPVARFNLAWALHRQRQYLEAEAEYRRALECGLDEGFVHANLAASLFNQGRYWEATGEYEKAIASRPVDDQACAAWHLYHGSSLNLAGFKPEAEKAYAKAIRLKPDFARAHLYLGFLQQEVRKEEAIDSFQSAIQLQDGLELGELRQAWEQLAGILLRTYELPRSPEELKEEILGWEKAQHLAGVGLEVSCLLAGYRQAYLPRLASLESAEALIDRPRAVLEERSRWRFFAGLEEPPADWREASFADFDWREALGPFAFPETSWASTSLDDMYGRYSSLYLRTRFTLDGEPPRDLILAVRADDAFAAYLNGREVARRHAGRSDSQLAHDAVAEAEETNPLIPERIAIDPEFLKAGENVLAIQALNRSSRDPDFFFSAAIEAGPPDENERNDRAGASLDALRAAGIADQATLTYLEGRRLQLAGDYPGAAEKFQELVRMGTSAKEPVLRLAECRRAAGDLPGCQQALRSALEAGSPVEELWDLWLQVGLVDLQWTARSLLDAFPAAAAATEAMDTWRPDIHWLMTALAAGETVRIDCGEERDGRWGGVLWSHDRFFRGGQAGHLQRFLGKEDVPQIYWTERFFKETSDPVPGYSLPLPRGRYTVKLHFGDGYCEAPGERQFDVLIEGEEVLSDYEPPRDGLGMPDIFAKDLEVSDGTLDIEFHRGIENPNLMAIEVRMAEVSGG